MYTAKVGKITVFEITQVNTWQKAISGSSGIRKWFIKARDNTDNAFDVAFIASPEDNHLTTDGSGFQFDDCALPDVYVRSATINTKIEILTFD